MHTEIHQAWKAFHNYSTMEKPERCCLTMERPERCCLTMERPERCEISLALLADSGSPASSTEARALLQ